MAQVIEFEIKYLFSRSKSPQEIAEVLLVKWNAGKLSFKQQIAASLFLLNSNLIARLLEHFSKLLLERQKIPWACFIEALSLSGLSLRRDDIDQILLGAAEEGALAELVNSRALDKVDARFFKIRKDLFPSHSSNLGLSPSVLQLKKQLFDFERRKTVLEEKKEHDELKTHFLNLARQNQENAYEISVSMHMMGLSEAALEVLALASESESKHWLELDLLLESEHYLDVLEKCDKLSQIYLKSFKATSALLYLRARAFKGLGQDKMAIETLEKLKIFNPNFLRASSLLLEWKSEFR